MMRRYLGVAGGDLILPWHRRMAKRLKAIAIRRWNGSRQGLDGLDIKILPYVDFDCGYFIEVGANDGYAQSNTLYLERERHWRGLLVEAIPDLAARCAKHRPASTTVNCALVSNTFKRSTIELRYAGLMSLVVGAQGNEQDENRHVQDGVQVQGLGATYTVEVPARTLSSVLDEQGAPERIDLFSLDVEGYELDVLQGLGLTRYRPCFIVVEARFEAEVHAFLTQHGYQLEARLSIHDLLYRDARH